MKFYIKLIRFIFVLAFITVCYQGAVFARALSDKSVTNYFPVFFPAFDSDNRLYIAIRSYDLDGTPYFLVVDPTTLQTYQKVSSTLNYRRPSHDMQDNGYIMEPEVADTLYYKVLQRYSAPPEEAYNYGLKHAKHQVDGVFLTIDMCPSHKPFEKKFFKTLISLGQASQKPLPIAIAITKLWAVNHQEEFEWLNNQRWLDITWVNHSLSHPYNPNIRNIYDNFLDLPRTNIMQEILSPEQMLISKGLTPSIFFRFPGLVSNSKSLKLMNRFGLIPVGTDAWLAKREKVSLGSIILVHGNSNEHQGIEIFIKLIKDNTFLFLPLRQSIAD